VTTQYADGAGESARRWQTTDAPVSEPGHRYIDFLVPGLMGLNIMGGGLFGVGFVIVDMRVRKLLKRLLATPMRRSHFLLAMLGSRLIMLLPEMTLLLVAARLGFGVPLRGNPLLLGLVILVGAFAFAGIGLVLASRTDKTETISGLINLVMLPGWLVSGTFFSSRRFPDAVQPLIQALPLTQLNDALREVMLEGASLGRVAGRLAVLAAWGGVAFLLALRWFRWQ
jgi:ABC transporter DrrB family efflux protein